MIDKTTRKVQDAYRRVFQTEDGKTILCDILNLLGFFNNVPERINPQCISVGNTILSRCGVIDSGRTGLYMDGLEYAIHMADAAMTYSKDDDEEELDDL